MISVFKQVLVNESALPAGLESPNALRTRYKTNLLFPLNGPVAEARAAAYTAHLLKEMWLTSRLAESIREYRTRYKTSFALPIRLQAPIRPDQPGTPDYLAGFVRPMRQYMLQQGFLSRPRTAPQTPQAVAGEQAQMQMQMLARLPVQAQLTERARDQGAILVTASAPNRVMADLFQAGGLALRSILNGQLIDSTDPLVAIAEMVSRPARERIDDAMVQQFRPMLDMALARLEQPVRSYYTTKMNGNPAFADNVGRYAVDKVKPWDWTKPVLPTDDPAREWALQRYEELQLSLETPVLRGPVQATPVAPKSSRVLTETRTQSTQEVLARRTGTASRFMEGSSLLTASAFQVKLDNLTEHGIATETAFSDDATLLSTLNDERRQVVETVAREISRAAETATRSEINRSTGFGSEYTTEGKDEKLSTTELQFQVVTPAHATVRLRDVGLVWCPRVTSPFRALHAHVIDYEEQVRLAYITQHYVPQPVKPVIKSVELLTDVFEVQIDGEDYINVKRFERRIPFTDSYARIDLDRITATHRNGTSDDFNWDEAWNWDDLENASARVRNLEVLEDGHLLRGEAVLETTDPEWLNRSFVTIRVPVITYTEETVAALSEYEQQMAEHDLKLEVVRSRAVQYAAMKRDELIAQFEESYRLQQEAFRALIRRVFTTTSESKRSYYEEVIRRCINWEEASVTFESQPLPELIMKNLPPDHFMNCPGIRFFLPVLPNAETLLFETIQMGGLTYYKTNAEKVRGYVSDYRTKIAGWKESSPEKLVLDKFDIEMQIGSHLEAVLSQYDFAK